MDIGLYRSYNDAMPEWHKQLLHLTTEAMQHPPSRTTKPSTTNNPAKK